MRILPTYCIPEDRKEHHAAVSKLEEKKEEDVSFQENTESRGKENIGKRLKHRARAKRNHSWENIPHVSHERRSGQLVWPRKGAGV